MAILGVRIWRTTDGRHVPDGHADAAYLAYGPGDDVPDHALPEQAQPKKAEPTEKAQPAAPNKAVKRAPNKAK
jgi:hypothetical protein